MGKLTLIHHPLCPYAARAHLALLYKGIDFEEQIVDVKNKSEEFLKLNPLGKVSVLLLEDGTSIYESLPVLELLDTLPQYAHTPKLYPTDPVEKAQAEMKIARLGGLINSLCSYVSKSAEAGLKDLDKKINTFEELIGEKPYLGGESPNVVDFAVIPWLDRYSSLPDFVEQLSKSPIVSAYIERVHKIPAVDTARVRDTFGVIVRNARIGKYGLEWPVVDYTKEA